jgi:hypothetical protein
MALRHIHRNPDIGVIGTVGLDDRRSFRYLQAEVLRRSVDKLELGVFRSAKVGTRIQQHFDPASCPGVYHVTGGQIVLRSKKLVVVQALALDPDAANDGINAAGVGRDHILVTALA